MSTLNLTADQQQLISDATPFFWANPSLRHDFKLDKELVDELYAAEARLQRFAPLLEKLFPELVSSKGVIESPLLETTELHQHINPCGHRTLVKADHALPVAGSIKARGGIHEVLCFTEKLALEHKLLDSIEDDYLKLQNSESRSLFQQYEIAVGSTGNLGLSVGIIGAALGFKASVHMSVDAKQWKKERLRNRGVNVVEHEADYGAAVAAGREQASQDPFCYFVDDENSSHLFMGYAVAALRLEQQLKQQSITVDSEHPLFVYLPAGVGGAPGGITFGLKHIFGNNVHCIFAEPTQAPCMLLGYATPQNTNPTSVYDFGLTIDTEADGLAVGTASQWVCDVTRQLVSAVFTCKDDSLYESLCLLNETEGLKVEPSAAIGCHGPAILTTESAKTFIKQNTTDIELKRSTHIIWTTGGSFVPEEEYQSFLLHKKSPKQK